MTPTYEMPMLDAPPNPGSDAAIELIARTKPTTVEELAEIPGVGRPLAHRAGSRILDAITPR